MRDYLLEQNPVSFEKIYFSTDRKAKYFDYTHGNGFNPENEWSSALTYPHFIQYLIDLKIKASLESTQDNGNIENTNKIDRWFESLKNQFRVLFQSPTLEIKFVWKPYYTLYIRENNEKSFTFNEMPDGYSALMSIFAELTLRSFHKNVDTTGLHGVVMIDEIENHLHIDLQKKILPFLTTAFPNVQFIVTTHSPFVINSISNAVVCDLEKREVIQEDLSSYSYDTIVEGYFNSDQYSDILKKNLEEFELLGQKSTKTEEEIDRYLYLRRYLKEAPKLFADELAVKLNQIEQQQLRKSA